MFAQLECMEDEMQRLLLTVSVGILICVSALPYAYADVYAWVDSSGTMTLSDLPPPPGVHVVNVVNENTPGVPPRAGPAPIREPSREADVRALSERIRQLEHQIELASYQPPPLAQYTPPAPSGWCNGAWADCGPWWSAPAYPLGFGLVVAPTRGFRQFHRFHGTAHGSSGSHHH